MSFALPGPARPRASDRPGSRGGPEAARPARWCVGFMPVVAQRRSPDGRRDPVHLAVGVDHPRPGQLRRVVLGGDRPGRRGLGDDAAQPDRRSQLGARRREPPVPVEPPDAEGVRVEKRARSVASLARRRARIPAAARRRRRRRGLARAIAPKRRPAGAFADAHEARDRLAPRASTSPRRPQPRRSAARAASSPHGC